MAGTGNPGSKLCDLNYIKKINISLNNVKEEAQNLVRRRIIKNEHKAAWLLKAITLIDLTTLAGDDTESNVRRLCYKAAEPLASDVLATLGFSDDPKDSLTTAAVCVYPAKVAVARQALDNMEHVAKDKIQVAAVATGFPTGQYGLHTRLDEIRYAVKEGATEIDIVIDRSLVLTGKWEQLYNEIRQMKEACGDGVHMKAILATGELANLSNVYKASYIAMLAGADFIKTSTGKEAINATLPFGIVMCRAIRDYHDKYGYKVGLKPAGGLKTSQDAINWLILVKEHLGNDWLSPTLFRFGASSLLLDIEKTLYEMITGTKPDACIFTMG